MAVVRTNYVCRALCCGLKSKTAGVLFDFVIYIYIVFFCFPFASLTLLLCTIFAAMNEEIYIELSV